MSNVGIFILDHTFSLHIQRWLLQYDLFLPFVCLLVCDYIHSLAQDFDPSEFWVDAGSENVEDPYLTSLSNLGSSDILASGDSSLETLIGDNPNDLLTASTNLDLETTNIFASDLTDLGSLTWVGPEDSFRASTNMNDAGIPDFEDGSSPVEYEPSSSDQLEWTPYTEDAAIFATSDQPTDQLNTIQPLDRPLLTPSHDTVDFEDLEDLPDLAFLDDTRPFPFPIPLETLDSIINLGSEVIRNLDLAPLLIESEEPPKCENGFPFCCLVGPPRSFAGEKKNRRRKCYDWSPTQPACEHRENIYCCFCRDWRRNAYECSSVYPPTNPPSPVNPVGFKRDILLNKKRSDEDSGTDGESEDECDPSPQRDPRIPYKDYQCTDDYLRSIGVKPYIRPTC